MVILYSVIWLIFVEYAVAHSNFALIKMQGDIDRVNSNMFLNVFRLNYREKLSPLVCTYVC